MEHKAIAERLSSYGVRPTSQRLAVYEYLLSHPIHPSVDTVYAALIKKQPSFSRTTVYNSLHTLVQAGLVRELPLCSEERRYDAGMMPHAHFRCTRCGCIHDVPLDDAAMRVACQPPAGVVVTGQELVLSGQCAACYLADTDAAAFI